MKITHLVPIFGLFTLVGSMPINAAEMSTKTYTFEDVRLLVSNNSRCEADLVQLTQFGQTPFSMQFAQSPTADVFDITETSGQILQHTFQVVSQRSSEGVFERIGIGSMQLNGRQMEYLIDISADVHQADFKYLYPMIVSSESGHCMFTVLLKPSNDTMARFRDAIRNDLARLKEDLIGK